MIVLVFCLCSPPHLLFKKKLLGGGGGSKMVEKQAITLIYSHKYTENTTTCGTIHTENLQKTDKRPQDYDRTRKTLQNHKKEEQEKKK